MKKARADFPEKAASISGRGEIRTYRIPNTTARVMTHLREVDTQSYYPIFNSGKRIN
jgi:hypothetical protein